MWENPTGGTHPSGNTRTDIFAEVLRNSLPVSNVRETQKRLSLLGQGDIPLGENLSVDKIQLPSFLG
jgi:hypothetical protein